VSGANAAQKETIEELTLVDVSPSASSVVYGLVFNNKLFDNGGASLSIKKAQTNVLKQNLKAKGFSDSLEFKPLYVSEFSFRTKELKNNYLALQDTESKRCLDFLQGSLGVEHNNHTVVHRVFGTVAPPLDADIRVIDGEFNRPGDLYTPAALKVALKNGKALPLLLGIVDPVFAHWPHPKGMHAQTIKAPPVP
jgi:hypothetical protein